MRVVALIHEENGVFGASFPDFPGATTVADDIDALIAKAAEALAFHVEGLAEDGPLPQVRTLAQLRKDPEFRKDAVGAMVTLVPYAPPGRAVRINVTMDESLLARIDRAAEIAGETRSGFLAEGAKARLFAGAGHPVGMMAARKTAERKPGTAVEDLRERVSRDGRKLHRDGSTGALKRKLRQPHARRKKRRSA